ncbi:MAG: LysR substrate-binding domain-containing protein [Pseudomonadota bacterium]|nr:LysR substrate-binding domain-containing protein [Pseudomonadota bacterium]
MNLSIFHSSNYRLLLYFRKRSIDRLHQLAPHIQVNLHSLGAEHHYANALESGELDAVIGNWPQPPDYLRLSPLFKDEVVCMMRKQHPLASQPMTLDDYLNADHIAPIPYAVGQRGVIDLHLARLRIKRRVISHVPYFNLVPYLLLQTDAVFSAPRMFAEHYQGLLPLSVVQSPIDFPEISFYLLWHDRSHLDPECRWFREQLIGVIRESSQAAQPLPRRMPQLAAASIA